MQITQLINNRGNAVANHFVITDSSGARYLQSYKSIVAKIELDSNGDYYGDGWEPVTFGRDWDYSVTTLKHLKTFLGFTGFKKELEVMIEKGEIEIDDNLKVGE